jgi:hypothetical protein
MSETRNGPGTELSGELLKQVLDEVRGRISERQRELDELQNALKEDRAEEALLKSLYALKTGSRDGPTPATGRRTRGGEAHQVVEESVAILQEAGRPVHISELMSALGERGTPIPGSGTQANVISHITRDDRIVRPSRGMYGLVEWGVQEAMPAKGKKKRRRVKSRTRVSTEG